MDILNSFPRYPETPEVGEYLTSPEGVQIKVTQVNPVSDYYVVSGNVTEVPKTRHGLLTRHSWIFRLER